MAGPVQGVTRPHHMKEAPAAGKSGGGRKELLPEGYDMSDTFQIVAGYCGHYAEFHLDAEELRGIADALGHHDAGAQEMLRAADAIEARDKGEL